MQFTYKLHHFSITWISYSFLLQFIFVASQFCHNVRYYIIRNIFKNDYLYLIIIIKESTVNITIVMRLTKAHFADQAVIKLS